MHLTLLGEDGLKKLSRLNHAMAVQTAERLSKINGVKVLNDSFFNEFSVELPKAAADIVERLAAQKIIAGVPASRLDSASELKNILLVAVTETTTPEHIEAFAIALEKECR